MVIIIVDICFLVYNYIYHTVETRYSNTFKLFLVIYLFIYYF